MILQSFLSFLYLSFSFPSILSLYRNREELKEKESFLGFFHRKPAK